MPGAEQQIATKFEGSVMLGNVPGREATLCSKDGECTDFTDLVRDAIVDAGGKYYGTYRLRMSVEIFVTKD